MSSRRKNLIFAAVICLLAALSWLWLQHSARGSGETAVVEYGDAGQRVEYPLNKNARYDLDTGYYTVHFEVQNGRIRFVDSPCPDHTCESFGWLQNAGDWAACLPARAKLSVVQKKRLLSKRKHAENALCALAKRSLFCYT